MVTTVFGARGNVGRHVAAGLRAGGEPVRVTSRDPDAGGFPPGAEVVAADLADPGRLGPALNGAERVFLYAVPEAVDGFVTAATAAGVCHVVLLSSAAVTYPPAKVGSDRSGGQIARRHLQVEQALEQSGLAWTFLRPGMFATNTRWWWARSIRQHSAVRMPHAEAHTAPLHERDIADLAVAALTSEQHKGRAYTLYGPQSLTYREMTAQLGQAIGRPVAFEELSPGRARAELGRFMPPELVDATLQIWAAGLGGPAPTSTITDDVLGRPGLTFAQWAADHAADFR